MHSHKLRDTCTPRISYAVKLLYEPHVPHKRIKKTLTQQGQHQCRRVGPTFAPCLRMQGRMQQLSEPLHDIKGPGSCVRRFLSLQCALHTDPPNGSGYRDIVGWRCLPQQVQKTFAAHRTLRTLRDVFNGELAVG